LSYCRLLPSANIAKLNTAEFRPLFARWRRRATGENLAEPKT
jgi:hypothetical protein